MMNRAKPGPILFLLSSLTMGGSERKTVRIANELEARGYDVSLAYLNPPITLLGDVKSGVRHVCLDRKGRFSYAAVRRLRQYVRSMNISRIVCINLYPLLYAYSALRLLPVQERPRLIVTTNTTVHQTAKERLSMLLYVPLLKRASKIVFGSRAQRELWCARYGLSGDVTTVIYNGVDIERFSSAALAGCEGPAERMPRLKDGNFVVGSVGQLRPVKNQQELLYAFAAIKNEVPNCSVLIAGDGSERPSLEGVVTRLGLKDRVTFLGEVKDVRPVLDRTRLFVLTSISETFSNAALEAMAMGKPVILSDVGGAREMIQDGSAGFVYRQGDIAALAALIKRLAMNPGTAREIGERGRRVVEDQFSFSRMMRDYEAILA